MFVVLPAVVAAVKKAAGSPTLYHQGIVVTESLTWWLDRQVALTLTDGRQCRAWVRSVRPALPQVTPDSTIARDGLSVPNKVVGHMTLTLFPEPPALDNSQPYPSEVTTPIYAGGEHGRPHAVRLLSVTEALRARLRPRRPPNTTTNTKIAS